MSRFMNPSYFLNTISDWGGLPWLIVEPGKRAQAQTPLGTYVAEVQTDNKSYRLSFNERACPTRFTASNRVAWEAEDHYRRLQAQQHQQPRMKPPKW
jgi:hypothetical protein